MVVEAAAADVGSAYPAVSTSGECVHSELRQPLADEGLPSGDSMSTRATANSWALLGEGLVSP